MKSLGHYSIEVAKGGTSIKISAAGIVGLVIVLMLAAFCTAFFLF